jgi:hypothetical protein
MAKVSDYENKIQVTSRCIFSFQLWKHTNALYKMIKKNCNRKFYMNFLHIQKYNHVMNNFLYQNFLFMLNSWGSDHMILFINTLCYDNVDDHEFLNCNMFFHWKCI